MTAGTALDMARVLLSALDVDLSGGETDVCMLAS
jgi:hypothetical protein